MDKRDHFKNHSTNINLTIKDRLHSPVAKTIRQESDLKGI